MNTNPQKSAREATRTVLMVDAQGRMRTIERFHQKLRIGIILMVGALLVAAGAGWFYIDGLRTQQALRHTIDALEDRVTEAEHQQELLLARAVKAETQLAPPKPVQLSPTPTRAASVGNAAGQAKRPPAPAVDQLVVKPKVAPSPPPEVSAAPEPVAGVEVEKLTVAYQRSAKVVTSEFTIRNTGKGQAQGRAVVVLSAKDDSGTPRLSLPAVPLNNGRPQGDTGSRFAIKNYMRLKIQRKVATPGLRFDGAEVFVFDMQGQLLQAKHFEVQLHIPAAVPPPAPSSTSAVSSSNTQESRGGQEDE